MESLKVMEKINSIEQLDALGVKICELLQVGIDKASIVVPETLQQIVAWTLYKNATISLLLIVIIVMLAWIMIPLCKKCVSAAVDDPDIIMYGVGTSGCFTGITVACVYLITESIPCFIKALVAPNLVIIEQLGGLVK